jgi:hypothetical protein
VSEIRLKIKDLKFIEERFETPGCLAGRVNVLGWEESFN